jgi:hypothetical protein
MSLERITDESLVGYYENVRQQVEADRVHKRRFTAGPTVRQYPDRLRDEMVRRRLQHVPILWPPEPGLTPPNAMPWSISG